MQGSLFDPPPESLPDRLFRLGLPAGTPVTLTRNRVTMLSWHARSGVRLHAGYAGAPDRILMAIVRFLARRTPRAERYAARRILLEFPAGDHVAPRPGRPRRRRPIPVEDRPVVDRLRAAHVEFNRQHFAGILAPVPIRISDRMRRRLGEFRLSRGDAEAEIIISRRHIKRHGWTATLDTLLHEMVHQWQAESGHPVDHRQGFRRKAREVGISPKAVADL